MQEQVQPPSKLRGILAALNVVLAFVVIHLSWSVFTLNDEGWNLHLAFWGLPSAFLFAYWVRRRFERICLPLFAALTALLVLLHFCGEHQRRLFWPSKTMPPLSFTPAGQDGEVKQPEPRRAVRAITGQVRDAWRLEPPPTAGRHQR
jgi:hypothetical protein